MDEKHLISVEQTTLGLALAVIAVSLLALSGPLAFGASIGAGLMALNAYALRRIGRRAFRTFQRPSAAILLFNLKMALLVGLVYVIIRYLHVDAIGFVVGISVFPVAIVIVAIRHGLRAHDAPPGDTNG